MAEGVPVVTTRVGAIPEVVGDAAVLVEPGDFRALAEALDGVLSGGAEVSALIDRGRLRSGTFTWSACARGLVDLYRDAAAELAR
jgi:glycosyltransferase involved in cell wall biosynthesis